MALYVGIDVSKDKFDACGVGEGGKKVFSLPRLCAERDLRYRCVELPPQKFTFKNCL